MNKVYEPPKNDTETLCMVYKQWEKLTQGHRQTTSYGHNQSSKSEHFTYQSTPSSTYWSYFVH